MRKWLVFLSVVLAVAFYGGAAADATRSRALDLSPGQDACHPAVNPGLPQYIIGYGSLMEETSRLRTTPDAGPAAPVEVRGFRRSWISRGTSVGFSTTFLGVTPVNRAKINGVVYGVSGAGEVADTDKRESGYCRERVPPDRITMLDGNVVPGGEIWIYVNSRGNDHGPTTSYPIVQSYVDIFLSGCLQMQDQFNLPGFARECILTTHGWSSHWVNDRIFPRRPFIYQPNAGRIDRLLQREIPRFFHAIRIE